jgi:pimeloyl-ACP methyl ester carboxylesterase
MRAPAVLVLTLLVAGCSASAGPKPQLAFRCAGSGGPTVVFESGAGGGINEWRLVQPAAARFTRVCSYDRRGVGASPPAHGRRDARDVVADLDALLDAAKIDPPWILVGHSWGGALARLFAAEHREDVAGVVFVEATTPEFFARERLDPARAPPFEHVDFPAALREVSGVRALGATRVVVLTRSPKLHVLFVPPPEVRRFERNWRLTQNGLARLSSDHVHAIARKSEHVIPSAEGQPALVVAAIRAVVRAAREDRPLPPCRAIFRGLGARCVY